MFKELSGRTKSILIIILLLPLFVMDVVHYFKLPEDTVSEVKETVLFPRGATLQQIADSLQAHHLVQNPGRFLFWIRMFGLEKNIRAGKFSIPFGLNEAQLAKYLGRARPGNIRVTLIEGWSTERICRRLSKKLHLSLTKLDSLANDKEFCRKLSVPAETLTGYLLPNTYDLPFGMTEEEVLSFLVDNTLAIFKPDSVREAMKRLNFSVHQTLTLASIVEGEAVLDKERPIIASVYLNRLKRGMRLQADPTIQFLIPDGPRRLLYRDLQIDSPYNTYRYKGLPPGPINNPGKASILAVLFSADTRYLYFVARGDGSHIFSKNQSEHLKAKRAFNRLRRKIARQKKLKQQDKTE
ncbi:MAG TPA: endolytic transglycosylase MltG [Caldithrix abyssi]|uniref:Endolytic murein transglycosylase n=1 Tax=Caldithrix abyssi TaxID=187145 RepID=A0A7V5PNE1_CALAY|nr:endolytic transglycosylase MltG [Caldithrix abyssi]